MDKGKTLIEQASLPKKNLWAFALMSAIDLINRLPNKSLNLKSSIEILEKLDPSVKLRNGFSAKGIWV